MNTKINNQEKDKHSVITWLCWGGAIYWVLFSLMYIICNADNIYLLKDETQPQLSKIRDLSKWRQNTKTCMDD